MFISVLLLKLFFKKITPKNLIQTVNHSYLNKKERLINSFSIIPEALSLTTEIIHTRLPPLDLCILLASPGKMLFAKKKTKQKKRNNGVQGGAKASRAFFIRSQSYLQTTAMQRQGNTQARRGETVYPHAVPAMDDSRSWQGDSMKGSDWRQQQALIPPRLWGPKDTVPKTFTKITYLVGNCLFLISKYLVEKNYIFKVTPSHCSLLSQTHLCGGKAPLFT